MKTANMKVWTDVLRATHLAQITGQLCQIDGDGEVIGMCCLGIGEKTRLGRMPEVVGNSHVGFQLERTFAEAVPGQEFHHWLGTLPPVLTKDGGEDVCIDWPPDLRSPDGDLYLYDGIVVSASGLNDELSLTFAQIADVIDYFGIKPLTR